MNATNGQATHMNQKKLVPLPQLGTANSRRPLPRIVQPLPKVTIEVGPPKGTKRLVIARVGNKEVHRDEINTNAAKSRKQFVEAILKARPALAGARERLDRELIEKSDEMDANLDKCEAEEQGGQKRGESSLDKTLEIAKTLALYKSPSEVAYADIITEVGRNTLPILSRKFQQWLRQTLYAKHQIAISQSVLDTAVQNIEAIALAGGEVKPVYTRIASHNGNIYIDLGQPDGKAVMISKKGVKIVLSKNVRFERKSQLLPLPTPVDDRKGRAIEEMFALMNLESRTDKILVLAFLLVCLNPDIPQAILAIHGPKGSAKSTLMRMIKLIIDPASPMNRNLPRSTQDLAVYAKNERLLAFDNISHLTDDMSDNLCRLTTGYGFATRKLYSDHDEALVDVRRPSMLNGIPEVATRQDFLDRLITVTLPAISPQKRRREREVFEKFGRILPRFLSCLYRGVQIALQNIERTRKVCCELPRLADVAHFVMAAMPAFGYTPEDFLNALNANQKESAQNALEASPIYGPLSAVLRKELKSERTYVTTAAELLEALNSQLKGRTVLGFPRAANTLSGELKRLDAQMLDEGIEITFSKSGSRKITFTKVK